MQTHIIIQVVSSLDLGPVFQQSVYHFYVYETNERDYILGLSRLVGYVTAIGQNLTYQLQNPHQGLFAIDVRFSLLLDESNFVVLCLSHHFYGLQSHGGAIAVSNVVDRETIDHYSLVASVEDLFHRKVCPCYASCVF